MAQQKTTRKVVTKKKPTARVAKKAPEAELPVRSVRAETAIQVGGAGLLLTAIFTGLLGFLVIAFNDTGSAFNTPLGLLIMAFGINLFAQAILVLTNSRRVDRYRQRIIALSMIVLPVVVGVISLFVNSEIAKLRYMQASSTSLLSSTSSVDLTFLITSVQVLLLVGMIAGSVWLWVLLKREDKLVWILVSTPKGKAGEKKISEQIGRNKRLGLFFLLLPVGLLALQLLVSFFSFGAEFAWAFVPILSKLIGFGWLPSVIAGVIFLLRSKVN